MPKEALGEAGAARAEDRLCRIHLRCSAKVTHVRSPKVTQAENGTWIERGICPGARVVLVSYWVMDREIVERDDSPRRITTDGFL